MISSLIGFKNRYSGRILYFHSNNTVQQKWNIVFNLVDRPLLLSHTAFHNDYLMLVKNMLINNHYPPKVIDYCISRGTRTINFRSIKKRKPVSDSNRKNDVLHKMMIPYAPYDEPLPLTEQHGSQLLELISHFIRNTFVAWFSCI